MANEIRDEAAQVYRDYVNAGMPSSGAHPPKKSEIRDLFQTVDEKVEGHETRLDTAETGLTSLDARMDAVEGIAVSGVQWKAAVKVATAAAGTLASSFENGDVVDGVTLATGNRILIKDQAAGAENGIYTVNATGAPTRATDADSGAELLNAGVAVEAGTTNLGTQWVCNTPATITPGTTPLTFVKVGDQGSYASEVEEARGDEIDLNSRLYLDAENASFAKFDAERRLRYSERPKALVLILIGQSGNTSRGTTISTIVSTDAYMPVGGNALPAMDFFDVNNEHAAKWSEFASVVVNQESPGESPISGAVTTVLGGHFPRVYACSVAVGSRTLDILNIRGMRCNLYAAVHRLCDIARADGYDPVVAYSAHHGEADMQASATESAYYADGVRYYRMAQLVAAQAMEKPGYLAPIVFHHPIEMFNGLDGAVSRDIQTAIRRLAKDIPNAIWGGGCYHFDSNTDRVHQSDAGYRQRGEHVGYLLRRFFSESIREEPLEVVDVTWSGTTATVLFSHQIVRDTSFDWGTNLDTANALAGFEWVDNGTVIQITAVTVQGRKAVLTLGSTPAGTAAEQKLRVATQTTTATLTAGANNRSGSQIRVDEAGRAAIYSYGDARYGTQYRWAVPQLCNVRAA